MYSVYAGTTCIYDDTSNAQNLRLINPVLELADSAAGSFKMTIPVTNISYDLIERLETTISVRKDGQEMWEGRVIDESVDYWKNRTLTCEGELAYLNDTIQPPAEYHDLTVRGFLETLLAIHNEKVPVSRQFEVGAVTVVDPNDSLYRYTNYEKTIECINDKLIDRLGGHLSIRKENGVRYLDYLADKQSTNTQIIEFGENLLDYTASFDMTEFATVLVPLGVRLDESPISALEAYTTVASVNEGRIYVVNASAYMNYGWIEKVVHFDRVTEPSNLLRKAREYLSEIQFDTMVLEVKAIDLHYMNPAIEGVKLTDQIRVVSEPHGLNRVFPVMKLSIPLDQPENTVFTLGDAVKTSLTDVNNKTNSEIIERINEMPTKQSVLDEARENAQAIMDLISNGFITITHDENGSEELYISDNQDILQSTRLWRWNINGLAYGTKQAGDPVSDTIYSIAMTMDGSIVADRITTGTLRADLLDAVRIKASTFILENESVPALIDRDVAFFQGDPNFALVLNYTTPFLANESYRITWGSIESSYICETKVDSNNVSFDGYYIGNPGLIGGTDDGSGVPFAMYRISADQLRITTYNPAGTIHVKIEKLDGETLASTFQRFILSDQSLLSQIGSGVSSIVPEYYLSTSNASPQGGSWTTTSPTWVAGKYMWTRSHIYYTDNTDQTTMPILDGSASGVSKSYTEFKQLADSLTLTAVNSGTPVGTLSSESYAEGIYRFAAGTDGYYASTNAGVGNSISYGKLIFNFAEPTTVSLDCISDGESTFDFGIVSNVDYSLSFSTSEDTGDGVLHSFNGEESPNVQTLFVNVPAGPNHFITFKYRKDTGTDVGEDVFKIKAYISDRKSQITLSGDGINTTSANINFTGLVTFSDLSGEGTTIINGANIETGSISADAINVNKVWTNDPDNPLQILNSTQVEEQNNTSSTIRLGTNIISHYNQTYIEIAARSISIGDVDGDLAGGAYARALLFDSEYGILMPKDPRHPVQLGGVSSYSDQPSECGYFDRIYVEDQEYIYVNSSDDLVFHDGSGNDIVLNGGGSGTFSRIEFDTGEYIEVNRTGELVYSENGNDHYFVFEDTGFSEVVFTNGSRLYIGNGVLRYRDPNNNTYTVNLSPV